MAPGCAGVDLVTAPEHRSNRREGVKDAGSWPAVGYDNGNTSYNPRVSGPGSTMAHLWKVPFGGSKAPQAPAVKAGAVFGQANRKVFALETDGSGERWSTDLGIATYRHSPTAAGERVYTAGIEASSEEPSSRLFALRSGDGSVEWTVGEGGLSTPPKVIGGLLFHQSVSDEGALTTRARSVEDGSEVWSRSCGECITRRQVKLLPPAVLDGVVYVSAVGGNRLFALDAADGSLVWERSFDRMLTTPPAAADGVLYLADVEGTAIAVRAESGDIAWTRPTDESFGPVYPIPAVTGDAVILADSYAVLALDAASGEERWRTDHGENNNAALAATNEAVYLGGTDVAAFDLEDGTVFWSYSGPGVHGIFTGSAVTDERLYFLSCIKEEAYSRYDHYVHAIGPSENQRA